MEETDTPICTTNAPPEFMWAFGCLTIAFPPWAHTSGRVGSWKQKNIKTKIFWSFQQKEEKKKSLFLTSTNAKNSFSAPSLAVTRTGSSNHYWYIPSGFSSAQVHKVSHWKLVCFLTPFCFIEWLMKHNVFCYWVRPCVNFKVCFLALGLTPWLRSIVFRRKAFVIHARPPPFAFCRPFSTNFTRFPLFQAIFQKTMKN